MKHIKSEYFSIDYLESSQENIKTYSWTNKGFKKSNVLKEIFNLIQTLLKKQKSIIVMKLSL